MQRGANVVKQQFIFDRRLNRVDAMYCFLNEVRNCNVSICLVAVLDDEPDQDCVRTAFERCMADVPRARDRLRHLPGDFGVVWVKDDTTTIDGHMDEVAIGDDGSWVNVLRVISERQSAKFDETAPPWRVTYIRGAPAGRAVIVLAMHHALADATAIAAMFTSVFMRRALVDAGVDVEAVVRSDAGDGVAEGIRAWCRGAAPLWRRSWPGKGELRSVASREIAELREYVRAVGRWPLAEHDPARQSALFRVRVDAWRQAAEARNGRINELYLAVAAASQRRYLDAVGIGSKKQVLRVIMPVNLRDGAPAQEIGSVTGAAELKLRGTADELEDLTTIGSASRRQREQARAAESTVVGDMLALLPGRIQGWATFRRFALTDVMATNIVAPLECEVAGVPVGMVFMIPPVIGPPVSFGLTGYGGWLHCAVTVDRGLVTHPEMLMNGAHDVIREIVGEANVERLGA